MKVEPDLNNLPSLEEEYKLSAEQIRTYQEKGHVLGREFRRNLYLRANYQ